MKNRLQTSRGKLWLFRVIAIMIGTCLALVAAEIGVRLYEQARVGTISDLKAGGGAGGEELRLVDIFQPSDNKRLIYEHAPSVEGKLVGVQVRTNSDGFYDPERAKPKPQGVFRIAAAGDSNLFGWGVPTEARSTTLLENFLNSSMTSGTQTTSGTIRFEVLNFGVIGYNTVLEAEQFRSVVLPYQPDVYLLLFTPSNDAIAPSFLQKRGAALMMRRLALLDHLRAAFRLKPRDEGRDGLYLAGPQIAEEYQFAVGAENCKKALAQISRDAAKAGVPAVFMPIFFFPPRPELVSEDNVSSAIVENPNFSIEAMRWAQELDFVFSDTRPAVEALLKEKGITWRDLWIDPAREDIHPGVAYHALLAREMYRSLVENELLPDSSARRARLDADLAEWQLLIDNALTSSTANRD